MATEKDNTKEKERNNVYAQIAALFGPDKALTIYNFVVWGSVVAFLLALGGCFG